MKIRIKDSSFRFRITLRELEELDQGGKISREALFPGPSGRLQVFRYAVKSAPGVSRGTLVVDSDSITLVLSEAEIEDLKNPDLEGIYLREEWLDDSGRAHRGIAFIEKDRPSSKCDKPEEWIYDDRKSNPSVMEEL